MIQNKKSYYLPIAEISLADHCNLNCRGCDHFSPHMPSRLTELKSLERDFSALQGHVRIGELKVAGGEPLLNPGLIPILKMIRETGVVRTITLISNGVLIHKIQGELLELIDKLWVTVYPNIKKSQNQDELLKQLAARNIKVWLNRATYFRQTVLNQRNSNTALVRKIFRSCESAHVYRCTLLYEGKFYRCASAPFIAKRHENSGFDFTCDGFDIHAESDIASGLQSFFRNRLIPYQACNFCAGSSGAKFPWEQMDKLGKERELTASHTEPSDFLDLNKLRLNYALSFVPFRGEIARRIYEIMFR